MWPGQEAQGILNTFKQSDPSDLSAVIFKISWKSDPVSGSNTAVGNTFTWNILKAGLGCWMLCLCQQWAYADTDKWTRRRVGDTTPAVSWVGSQALWGTLKPTFFVSFRGILQDSNTLWAAGAGGRWEVLQVAQPFAPKAASEGKSREHQTIIKNLHCH